MKSDFKKLSCCIIFLILFFNLSVFVSAEQFTIDTSFTIKSGLPGDNRAHSTLNRICGDTGDHTCSSLAYCTDHDYNFRGGITGDSSNPINYSVDADYMNKKKCYYKFNGKEYYNGKCSELAGYVLAWANHQFSYSDESYKNKTGNEPNVGMFADDVGICSNSSCNKVNQNGLWYWKQSSLWAYFALADSKNDIGLFNSKAANWYAQNALIRQVIDHAMDEYAKHSGCMAKDENGNYKIITEGNCGTITLNTLVGSNTKKDVNFTLGLKEGGETKFYYVPNSDATSCEQRGFYSTKSIVVRNNEAKKIIINLSTNQQSDVEVCVKDENSVDCQATNERELDSGQTIEFYLKSIYDVDGEVVLNVVGSYEENVKYKNSSIQYDTTRYVNGIKEKQGILTHQSYFLQANTDANVDYSDKVMYSSAKFMNFTRQKITRRKCPNSENISGDGENISSSATSNSQEITCASSLASSSPTNGGVKDYVARFSGCTCYTLEFVDPNDETKSVKKVNLIVSESAAFQYGKIVSDGDLYAGGGFYFDEKEVPTYYEANIGWTYSDYIGTTPYYYNEANIEDYDASKYDEIINETLREKLKMQLEINFKTRNSNDYKDISDYDITLIMPLKITNEERDYKSESSGETQKNGFKNVYTIKSTNYLHMPHAYFSKSGNVQYFNEGESNAEFSILGGNNYYVPMYYDEPTFPFNIAESDITVFEPIDNILLADCMITVTAENNFANLYYRSIDVNNPFPNADISDNYQTGVPSNWREWYYTGENANINFQRINQTYINYPDSVPLYSITLNSEKLNKIGGIQDYYTDWSKMESDGTSTFVDDFFEIKAAGGVSYCGLGQFKTDCDN